jgi:hypothetical protein
VDQNSQPSQQSSLIELLHRPKSLVIILLCAAIMLGSILLFSFLSRRSNLTESPPQQSQILSPTPVSADVPVESIYTDDFLTFDFPDDWDYEVSALTENKGTAITFMPKSVKDDTVPAFIVSYDTDSTTIEERISMFEKMGLKRGTILVNNLAFLKVSGTSIDRVVKDDLVEDPMQLTYAFARVNDYTVLVKYMYDGEQLSQENENLFRSFIENLTFRSRGQ